MTQRPHTSVLLDEVVEALAPHDGGVYLDMTLGAGGHASAILEASAPTGRLLGIDRDPAALAIAGERFAAYGERATLVHGQFSSAADLVRRHGLETVDGALLDAGVSSMQFDEGERGFSFRYDAPLDMRMSQQGESAGDLLDRLDVRGLADILRTYGELRDANRLADRMLEARAASALQTTGQLAELCAREMPSLASPGHHPATRVFQALRIVVNDELGELERALEEVPHILAPGAVFAVITFHSLEDRLAKRTFRKLARSAAPRGLPLREEELAQPWELLRDVKAGAEEIAANPRARSARLRLLRRREDG